LLGICNGFVPPQPFTSNQGLMGSAFAPNSILNDHTSSSITPSTTSVKSALTDIGTSSSFFVLAEGGGILEVVQNFAVVITGIIFLLAGLTFLTASVIVPAAAKELEKECLELNPELWNEYQRKLEQGQTIAQRPDLMQEMGTKLQPLIDQKVERMFAEKEREGVDVGKDREAWQALDDFKKASTPPPSSPQSRPEFSTFSTNQWDDDSSVIDAKVVNDDEKKA